MKIKLTLTTVLIALVSVFLLSQFKVKTISLTSSNNCLDSNSPTLGQFRNKNLIILNTKKAQDEVKKTTPCIKDIKIEKSFPTTLKIDAFYFVPVARIDGTDLSVTDSGLITQKTQDFLPTIFLKSIDGLKPGDNIKDTQELFALKITSELQKSDFMPANVRILDDGDIAVYSNQEAVALFTSQQDASSQVDSLQSILAKAKISAAKIAKVDLRFAKPVLVYK